eukprot:Gb_02921 [translate_table: standard]
MWLSIARFWHIWLWWISTIIAKTPPLVRPRAPSNMARKRSAKLNIKLRGCWEWHSRRHRMQAEQSNKRLETTFDGVQRTLHDAHDLISCLLKNVDSLVLTLPSLAHGRLRGFLSGEASLRGHIIEVMPTNVTRRLCYVGVKLRLLA